MLELQCSIFGKWNNRIINFQFRAQMKIKILSRRVIEALLESYDIIFSCYKNIRMSTS